MFEVWHNLAPFGGRLIGGAIEALLTKAINSLTAVVALLQPLFFSFVQGS
jgi:hypothetical protein